MTSPGATKLTRARTYQKAWIGHGWEYTGQKKDVRVSRSDIGLGDQNEDDHLVIDNDDV